MKILFAGEGGQGVQVIAEILAQAAYQEGKNSTYIPNFGVEQRGGISLAFVVIDNKPVVYPKFEKADILAVLSNRSWERVESYLSPQTKIIKGPAVKDGFRSKLPPKVWNIEVLGKVNEAGKLVQEKSLMAIMEKRFAQQFGKNPELKALDQAALTKK